MNHSVIIRGVRRRPLDGLDQVIAAAVRVFGDKGYRRTQMADVAREMGVAPGTLYGYVRGKEALFHLVIDRAFADGAPPTPALPIAAPPAGATLTRLRERLTAEAAIPALDGALRRRRVDDPARELETVVGELYDLIARTWPGIVLLERSALDWPELAQVFYGDVRRALLERLERYLGARMAARLLPAVPSEPAAAVFILETIAWFAMHRHRHHPASAAIDDAVARATTVALLVNAFAPAARPRRRAHKETRR